MTTRYLRQLILKGGKRATWIIIMKKQLLRERSGKKNRDERKKKQKEIAVTITIIEQKGAAAEGDHRPIAIAVETITVVEAQVIAAMIAEAEVEATLDAKEVDQEPVIEAGVLIGAHREDIDTIVDHHLPHTIAAHHNNIITGLFLLLSRR